ERVIERGRIKRERSQQVYNISRVPVRILVVIARVVPTAAQVFCRSSVALFEPRARLAILSGTEVARAVRPIGARKLGRLFEASALIVESPQRVVQHLTINVVADFELQRANV